MLAKILEEIEEGTREEDAPIYCGNMEVDGYVRMTKNAAGLPRMRKNG